MIMDRQLAAPAQARSAPTTTSFAYDFQHGRKVFHDAGCAGCHVPMLVLGSPILALDGMPPIDLSKEMRQPGLRYEPSLGGYPVWLFSDLKRHDMGKANAARHVQRGVALGMPEGGAAPAPFNPKVTKLPLALTNSPKLFVISENDLNCGSFPPAALVTLPADTWPVQMELVRKSTPTMEGTLPVPALICTVNVMPSISSAEAFPLSETPSTTFCVPSLAT
jgi:hypothetical protein